MYFPSLEEVKKLAQNGNLVPIYREIVADLETPVSAFLKVSRGDYAFLLESVEGGQRLARYSFIGTEPYKVVSTDMQGRVDILPLLAEELNKYKLAPVHDLPRFCGGAIGYLGYEAATHFEDLPSPDKDELGLPQALFMFVNNMLVFDHVMHKIKVISLARLDGDIEESYRKAVVNIDILIKRLSQPLHLGQREEMIDFSLSDNRFDSNFCKGDFEAGVSKIKGYIDDGEVIQVVLSQRLKHSTNLDPFDIYRVLRTINPSPYMFFLNLKDFQIIGASPEVLVRVEDGVVTTRPLAGTRPRVADPVGDDLMERELRCDEKECAEHIMLVDLARNDIGRVSQPGTVAVTDLMEIERYSHVMHLVTHVQGKLKEDATVFDALRACFPAGTVSGAPKIRAMEIIAQLEPDKRGPYAGAVGYFSYSDNMDMCIAIRTIVMRDGVIYIQAGCGVVYDSVPEKEYQETLNKARALLMAISQAERTESIVGRRNATADR